jgi:hypothetical protein
VPHVQRQPKPAIQDSVQDLYTYDPLGPDYSIHIASQATIIKSKSRNIEDIYAEIDYVRATFGQAAGRSYNLLFGDVKDNKVLSQLI